MAAMLCGTAPQAQPPHRDWFLRDAPGFRAGQLWNTIDERFLDPRYLPEEWDDPEHPLYRLPGVAIHVFDVDHGDEIDRRTARRV
jgi:hypothetical protein